MKNLSINKKKMEISSEKPQSELNCNSNCSSSSSNENNNNSLKLISSIENVPAYCSRFSLCILDVIRKLQQHSVFEKGVEKCHIIEYLKYLPNMDGDVSSQVMIALRELEINGYIMHMKQGYKTIGPFAKLCMAKTPRQRRILWRKLDMKFNFSCSDLPHTVNSSPNVCSNNNNNNNSNSNNDDERAGGDARNNSVMRGNHHNTNSVNHINTHSNRKILRSTRSEINLVSDGCKNRNREDDRD